jgi:hypothetical protein
MRLSPCGGARQGRGNKHHEILYELETRVVISVLRGVRLCPSRGGLSGLAGVATRPAGYPSGGVPPAVERRLHLHHTPSRVPQWWGTTSCREAALLTTTITYVRCRAAVYEFGAYLRAVRGRVVDQHHGAGQLAQFQFGALALGDGVWVWRLPRPAPPAHTVWSESSGRTSQ